MHCKNVSSKTFENIYAQFSINEVKTCAFTVPETDLHEQNVTKVQKKRILSREQ